MSVQYSSNPAERACSVLVARRQKHKSMHWITKGVDHCVPCRPRGTIGTSHPSAFAC